MQLVVVGLSTGSAFALVGIGLVLVYRTTGIVNFAQGVFAVIGGLVTFRLADDLQHLIEQQKVERIGGQEHGADALARTHVREDRERALDQVLAARKRGDVRCSHRFRDATPRRYSTECRVAYGWSAAR